MQNSKRFILLACCLTSLLACVPKKTALEKKQIQVSRYGINRAIEDGIFSSLLTEKDVEKGDEIIITVIVHGTMLPYPSLGAFEKFIKNIFTRSENRVGWYESYTNELRKNGIYKYQPVPVKGLHIVKKESNEKNKNQLLELSVHLYQKFSTKNDQVEKQIFYTFGWNGLLSHKEREKEACNFYKALVKKSKELQEKTGKLVKIHLVGHSHGGNVILNLARAEKKIKKDLKIEKAILVATPIQIENEHLTSEPIFENIYSIFSKGDVVQVLDIVSSRLDTKRYFGERKIRRKKGKAKKGIIPEYDFSKVKQLEILVGENKPLHGEFWLWGLISSGNIFYNTSVYRHKLSLHPFPLLVLVPLYCKMLDDLKVSGGTYVTCCNDVVCGQATLSVKNEECEAQETFNFDALKKYVVSYL